MFTLRTTLTFTLLFLLTSIARAGESVNIIPVTGGSVAIIPVPDEPTATHFSSTPSIAVTTSHSALIMGSDGIPLTRDTSSTSSSVSLESLESTHLATSASTLTAVSSSVMGSGIPSTTTSTKTSAGHKNEAEKIVGTVAAGMVVAWIAMRVFVHACVGVPVPRLDGGVL
ncbi:hypothetical protein BDZ45DRAFT_673464 [Acephala macrosclerotiorum]|nr:hypothetical protein BDZ45DRAFT_673464 [Acephala macrosclerotiorum]